MKHILYFKSRKNFADKSTWRKEVCPSDAKVGEVRKAARLAGCEGFAIVNFTTGQRYAFEWFVK